MSYTKITIMLSCQAIVKFSKKFPRTGGNELVNTLKVHG